MPQPPLILLNILTGSDNPMSVSPPCHELSLSVYVLYYYSMLNNKRMASLCHTMIMKDSLICSGFLPSLFFAYYYDCVEKKDSAIAYCEKALELSKSLEERYDATKLLFALNKSNGDDKTACRLAYSYMQLSDSLDFGKRQEKAAQIIKCPDQECHKLVSCDCMEMDEEV